MRRTLVPVSILLALSLLGARAAESSVTRQSIVGSGTVTFFDFPPGGAVTEHFVVMARSSQDGGAEGFIFQRSQLGDLTVSVTCLVVDGDTAVVGGRIVSGFTYFGGPVSHLALKIRDAGLGSPEPDAFTGFVFRPRPADFDPCAEAAGAPTPYVVHKGGFVVTDH